MRDGDYAGKNYQRAGTLSVMSGARGENSEAYLKFDLSRIKGAILKATLFLMPVVVGEGKIRNSAYYVPENIWSSGGITWANRPKAREQLSTGTVFEPNMLADFDLTAQAKPGQILSVQIATDAQGENSARVEYGALENSSIEYRPRLVVVSTAQ